MKQELYKHLASKLQAQQACIKSHNVEWIDKHSESITQLVYQYMPSGSGLDSLMQLDESSTPNKLVFTFEYHHMNDAGYYVKWTGHKLIVTPSLALGFEMMITGQDYNEVKEYLYQTFDYCLKKEVEA